MEKFIKSIFQSNEKRRNSKQDEEDERNDFTPPLDERRKLSISRSGRMKQANKKRKAVNIDLYGENLQAERPSSLEYHVNSPVTTQEQTNRHNYNKSETQGTNKTHEHNTRASSKKSILEGSIEEKIKTPDEEIDSAFQTIDKLL